VKARDFEKGRRKERTAKAKAIANDVAKDFYEQVNDFKEFIEITLKYLPGRIEEEFSLGELTIDVSPVGMDGKTIIADDLTISVFDVDFCVLANASLKKALGNSAENALEHEDEKGIKRDAACLRAIGEHALALAAKLEKKLPRK